MYNMPQYTQMDLKSGNQVGAAFAMNQLCQPSGYTHSWPKFSFHCQEKCFIFGIEVHLDIFVTGFYLTGSKSCLDMESVNQYICRF